MLLALAALAAMVTVTEITQGFAAKKLAPLQNFLLIKVEIYVS